MAHSSQTPHHFEVISTAYDVSTFYCENDWLTNYLKTRAVEETTRNHSRTFLCLDETTTPEGIVGFITLRAAVFQVGAGAIIPVAELVCLARHADRRGEDWGNVLLSEALAKVSKAGRLIGLAAVQLQPTPQGRPLYESMGFRDHPIYGDKWMYLSLHRIPELAEMRF